MAPRKKNKRKRVTKQLANNAELMRRRIFNVIRQQGEPFPVGKLPAKLAKKYPAFPKIPQVFRCNPLVLLEQQMSSAVSVSYNAKEKQYYVSAIKNARLAKGPKKLKRPPQIKERARNMFVEDLPKDQTFTQQSNALKTIISLVRDAESDWVQLSTLSQLYKNKTGVDLRCKNLFGCTLPKLVQIELAHKLFSEKRTSGELWVTYIPDPQEAEEGDDESERESDTEEDLEQLRAQMENMGFPKPLVKPEFGYFDLKPPGQPVTEPDLMADEGGETLEKEVKQCLDSVLEIVAGPKETGDESLGEEDAYGSEGFWD